MLVGHLLAGLALAATQAIPAQQLTLELRYDEDDRFPLTRVASMALGESGVLYVADALELSVAILDSTGRVAGTIGREGLGPGEFASIGAIGVFGDTVWAVDPALRRLLLFDTSGTTRVTISGQRTDTATWPAFPIETPPETVLRGAHVTLAASTSSPQQRNWTRLALYTRYDMELVQAIAFVQRQARGDARLHRDLVSCGRQRCAWWLFSAMDP
jgi:hypothetical protein